MVKIRLVRLGTKKKPFYRIVAIDKKRKRGGRPLEVIGYWNPIKKDIKLDKGRLKYWINNGAQVTVAVNKLLK